MTPKTSSGLPGAFDLVADTFAFYRKTFNLAFRTSSLLIVAGLACFVLGFALHKAPAWSPSLAILSALLVIAILLLVAFAGIRLTLVLLNLEKGTALPAGAVLSRSAWMFFLPLLWVGALKTFVVVGSFFLFIVPAIYFGIALYFVDLVLLDQNARGLHALPISRDLVAGRWWATFWRCLVASVIFGVAAQIVIYLAAWAIQAASSTTIIASSSTVDPLQFGTMYFIQLTVLALFLPLFQGFKIKLYRALQKAQ